MLVVKIYDIGNSKERKMEVKEHTYSLHGISKILQENLDYWYMLKCHTNMNTETDVQYKQLRRDLSLKYWEFYKYYSRLDSPAQIIQMVMKEKRICGNCLNSYHRAGRRKASPVSRMNESDIKCASCAVAIPVRSLQCI